MSEPKISIIMPTYNVERYIRHSISCIQKQTLQDIELILVDDGSTDSTIEIAKESAKGDSRIVICKEEHHNAGHARNVGLAHARGEYLAILDSDDIFEADMLDLAYKQAVRAGYPDVVLLKADRYLDHEKQFIDVPWMLNTKKFPSKTLFSPEEIHPNIFRSMVGWTWDKLFKRSSIEKHSIRFQEQRAFNDLLFTFSAIILAETITVLDSKPLVHQRKRGGGSISDKKNEAWPYIQPALLGLRDVLVDNGLYQRYEREYINYALHLIDNNISAIPVSDPGFPDFYNAVRSSWHLEFGLPEHNSSYFFVKTEWDRYRFIINHSLADYVARIAGKETENQG